MLYNDGYCCRTDHPGDIPHVNRTKKDQFCFSGAKTMARYNPADQASKENLMINKKVVPSVVVLLYGAGLRTGGYTHVNGGRTQTKGGESQQ